MDTRFARRSLLLLMMLLQGTRVILVTRQR